MPFALGAVALLAGGSGIAWRGLAGNGRLRASGSLVATMMLLPVAIMARRPTLIGAATGAPNLNQFRLGRRSGYGWFSWRCLGSGSGFNGGFRDSRRFGSRLGGNL
jgi:hypothetical protein